MKRIFIFALLGAITACGDVGSPRTLYQNPFGEHYDDSTPSGMRVRYSQINNNMQAVYAETWARRVAACVGVNDLPMPLVIYTNDRIVKDGQEFDGMAYFEINVILLFDLGSFSHEIIHLALRRAGVDDNINQAHERPEFQTCLRA